jgi:hypothetical protein
MVWDLREVSFLNCQSSFSFARQEGFTKSKRRKYCTVPNQAQYTIPQGLNRLSE